MSGLRVLITNNTLANCAGTELYVRDLATALLSRGHSPIAYSPILGQVAVELRKATIPVVDNLNQISINPDVIHGHHHLETTTALLHFPDTPAVFVCHGWLPWQEAPPRFRRIRRYLAVDRLCYERLTCEHAIPQHQVQLMLNFVDLERFKRRAPLPAHPRRALLFSHDASERNILPTVQTACSRTGIALDVIGAGSGRVVAEPETVLGQYDIVFAKGRSAIEALAVGAAVILCDLNGIGPLVTRQGLDHLRDLNFGIRTLRYPLTVENLVREIELYDPGEAEIVSQSIRQTAGHQVVIDDFIDLYRQIIDEQSQDREWDTKLEEREAAEYLRWLSPFVKKCYSDREILDSELTQLTASSTFKIRKKLLELPLIGRAIRTLARHPLRS